MMVRACLCVCVHMRCFLPEMWGWNLAHHEFKGVNPKPTAHQQEQTCLSLSLSLSVFVSLSTSLYLSYPLCSCLLEFCKEAGWTIKHTLYQCLWCVCLYVHDLNCLSHLSRWGLIYMCVCTCAWKNTTLEKKLVAIWDTICPITSYYKRTT